MATLKANLCVECHNPVGYVSPDCLMLPTLCVACAGHPETMAEWGHEIGVQETPIDRVLERYQHNVRHVQRMRKEHVKPAG